MKRFSNVNPAEKASEDHVVAVTQNLKKKVAKLVIEQRNRLLGVSVELTQWKARDIAREMGIPRENFKGLRGWAQKFTRRNGFSLR